MTNWYSIFYWLTVADGIKDSTFVICIITLIGTGISLIGWFVSSNSVAEAKEYGSESSGSSWNVWKTSWWRVFISCFTVCFITFLLYVFIPSKRDALIIIAGGTVGNFVTQDSSAKKIPSEVMMLLRTKIQEEIKESSLTEMVTGQVDTLKDKSKEELIELLKKK